MTTKQPKEQQPAPEGEQPTEHSVQQPAPDSGLRAQVEALLARVEVLEKAHAALPHTIGQHIAREFRKHGMSGHPVRGDQDQA